MRLLAAEVDPYPPRSASRRIERRAEMPGGRLPQRGKVVQDPDAAPVGAGDEVTLARVNHEIADRDLRQIVCEPLPAAAAVDRRPYTPFGADEEQVLLLRVLDRNVAAPGVRQVGGDVTPGFAAVVGPIDIGVEVVHPVVVDRQVGAALGVP